MLAKSTISLKEGFTALTGLATFGLLSACSQAPQQSISIPFSLTYHNQIVNCEQFGNRNSGNALRDFRLYLHHLELQNDQDEWVKLKLDPQNAWQNDSTVLLDFENGEGKCTNGNRETNQKVTGLIDEDQYHAIRFTIGVPFELNHQNPLTAKPPLDESSMHWHWQGGYKFVRAEFNINDSTHRLHIGSLRCKGQINDISHCEQPNRATITLEDLKLPNTTIAIALDTLIDFSLEKNDTKLTCMGDNQQPWCANAMDWIGLGENQPQMMFNTIIGKP